MILQPKPRILFSKPAHLPVFKFKMSYVLDFLLLGSRNSTPLSPFPNSMCSTGFKAGILVYIETLSHLWHSVQVFFKLFYFAYV